MGGDSSAAGEAIAVSAIITLFFTIVLPWILFIWGRKSDSQTGNIVKWIGTGFASIPLILLLLWFTWVSTGPELPLKPPLYEEINTDSN